MHVYPDHKLIRKFTYTGDTKKNTFFLNQCIKTIPALQDEKCRFVLDWSSLLEYLDFGMLFEQCPKLDGQDKIFSTIIEVLKLDAEKDVIVHLYDQIFVECLTQIKGLTQIQPQFLVDQIHFKLANPLFQLTDDPFASTLHSYEKKLTENPYETIHDLTLYLAWDRICVYMGAIFDDTSLHIQNGLKILNECLVESFKHITEHGKTTPSMIRLVEALFAFHMKQENLQLHTEKEWEILCRGAPTLQSRDYFPDVSYLDSGITAQEQTKADRQVILTLEPLDKVKDRLALVDLIFTKLKMEDPDWKCFLRPCEIFCIKETDSTLLIDSFGRI